MLISEKWDKGFLGVNLLDDVIFKQDETKKIHSILNHLSDLSALTLSIEQQHDINSIFTEHLPELISEYAPIPGQIKEQTQAGETFNTSLDKIYQHLDTIYHQAFDSNIAKIQAKSQFFDNKKMSNSL